ncbi:MAG: NTP transferase domain-containing protein [Candidatus Hydrogenedentes bacterium]|nr:NTP transferase domain-containing protein [Candidatus Hydrogenedentota bacterium]
MTIAHPSELPPNAATVFGLVLAGGRSTRMGEDKAALAYHETSQVEHGYELLASCCEKVFVSIRERHPDHASIHPLPHIADSFLGFGPMGGILSAMTAYPDTAWLVLACDMPFVEASALRTLLRGREPHRIATAFIASDGAPEPLCTLYEPASRAMLHTYMARGRYSLRDVLRDADARLLDLPDPEVLRNANTPEERDAAQALLDARLPGPRS